MLRPALAGPCSAGAHMRVGLVADTHGVFDPALCQAFASVDLILHAGDVGNHGGHAAVLSRLRQLAPTTAVCGNVDDDPQAAAELASTAVLRLAGWTVLLLHVLASSEATAAVQRHQPDIVVHGHTHKYSVSAGGWGGGGGGPGPQPLSSPGLAGGEGQSAASPPCPLLVNPGSAGPARFRLGRSAAILLLPGKGSGEWPSVERVELGPKAPPRLPEARGGAKGKTARAEQQQQQQPQQQQQQQQAPDEAQQQSSKRSSGLQGRAQRSKRLKHGRDGAA